MSIEIAAAKREGKFIHFEVCTHFEGGVCACKEPSQELQVQMVRHADTGVFQPLERWVEVPGDPPHAVHIYPAEPPWGSWPNAEKPAKPGDAKTVADWRAQCRAEALALAAELAQPPDIEDLADLVGA